MKEEREIGDGGGGSAGADPGFDEGGGSDKRPPKAVAPRGFRGHAPPENV